MVWQLCMAVQNILDFHITAATTETQHLNELFIEFNEIQSKNQREE